MENELLDFKAQENFDFFTYRYELTDGLKRKFLSDCQNVLERAHATALETLKLASALAKLKWSYGWKEVINPEDGMTFIYSSFEKFCKYAFGFSKTKTSNLLSLSEFVELNEKTDTIVYKHKRYASMNMSQLIELAPLGESERKLFTSKIPVSDMRLCKKYMDDDSFLKERNEKGFDLLANAKRWEEEKQTKNAEKIVEEIEEYLETAPETEFMEMVFPENTVSTDSKVPTSEFLEDPTREISFSCRANVRKFLAEFERWETIATGGEFFDEVKRFRFKNGTVIYATTCKNCIDVERQEEKTLAFYFLSRAGKTIKISKAKLEIWLKANERLLL